MSNKLKKKTATYISKKSDGRYVLDSYSKVLNYILNNSKDNEINLSDCVLVPCDNWDFFDIRELYRCAQSNGQNIGITLKENCENSFIITKRVICKNSIIEKASFHNTYFEEYVGFEKATLTDIRFTYSTFKNCLSISNCQIHGYLVGRCMAAKSIFLHDISYDGSCIDFTASRIASISILSSTFRYSVSAIKETENNPNILHTDFNFARSILGDVFISKSSSEMYISFLDSDIKQKIGIYNSNFDKGIIFENCSLCGIQAEIQDVNVCGIKDNSSINLRDCKINTDVIFNGVSFDFIDASGCKIEKSGRLSIFYTSINNINFVRATIFGEVNFNQINPNTNDMTLIDMSCTLNNGIIYISLGNIKVANYDTAKILRLASQKLNNSIEVTSLKAIEHNLYLKENKCKLSFDSISDYLLLLLNKTSNNFGTNWMLGVFFCVITSAIFTGLIGWTLGEYSFCINPKEWIFLSNEFGIKTFSFLWLPNLDSFKELSSNSECNAWTLIFFIIGKSLIAYGIFQTVAAFRKYCCK